MPKLGGCLLAGGLPLGIVPPRRSRSPMLLLGSAQIQSPKPFTVCGSDHFINLGTAMCILKRCLRDELLISAGLRLILPLTSLFLGYFRSVYH